MITSRSTYEQIVKEIDESAAEVAADAAYDGIELSPDEVWTDLAASLLIDANEAVARDVCRCQIGFVPQDLERIWEQRRLARAEKARKAAIERAAKLRVERAAAEQERRRTEIAAVRSARCERCFTVPAANGRCFC